jgi:thiol-disulfide isomerase/thioredoxin
MPVRKRDEVAARRCAAFVVLLATVVGATVTAGRAQRPAAPDIVASVRTVMAAGGLVEAEKTLNAYRAQYGSTPDAVDALLWLARGALGAKLYDKANAYASGSREMALAILGASPTGTERVHESIGVAAELLALVLVEQGARAEAVYSLRRELEVYHDTPAGKPLRASLDLLSLHGQPAPALDRGMTLGSRLADTTKSAQPTLVFFWAHWCQECKAESPMLEKMLGKYRSRGLEFAAPTRRYGFVDSAHPAAPDKELRHIAHIRDTFYRFLKQQPVPITDANYKAFGVSVVPLYVLTDRQGLVRLYHPGRIGEAELEAAVVAVLDR